MVYCDGWERGGDGLERIMLSMELTGWALVLLLVRRSRSTIVVVVRVGKGDLNR